ncbi:hypothetical protein K6U56_16005 [Vibrio furnissii]|uniref:hypothetical protein n=1 Tax=Vibrio furnissii TaxID=29494 RepID=UPI001EEBC943|nr:hypothetical protein [Vibrio furnissii]MCG6213451.1 hypothetical protein [Vibrio furnissii]WJG22168.1 hypothetical protein QSU95_03095 [Vibrio furnissii]
MKVILMGDEMNLDDYLEEVGVTRDSCKYAYVLKNNKTATVLNLLNAGGYVEKMETLSNGQTLMVWVQAN